ncbi:Crp/Fnr family transcriptional regulator [Pedobacter riviphilus]|uniref:Crp/Fnr family transcriptional regulator n=1 Tax=Pedobacter riviphilus TaxID=2766984 RepID=A0ABX6TN61_9SPHI|nr:MULTISPECIES: Crp/Fnr family transcriptional regulator [Pedobacter]NII84790.1 CRP-like cAMP-binding protein [Pedobacter sp. SG908]QNR84585.1 Crp/Fnr family transcriptional regulator [Pedobacter riviphilus]
MEQIRRYFEQHFKLTDKDWEIFASQLVRQEFPKKHIILKAGQTENFLSFIEKGIIRFYIPKEASELTFAIAFDNGFVSAYNSFLTKQPSTYHVETLTATALWRMSYDGLQTVYRETKIGNSIGRWAAEDQFLKKTERELSLLNDTAEQRYLRLFSEQPKLIEKIPLKYIASYIGITPQALSRIRRRIYL